MENTAINQPKAQNLADAANNCWEAIQNTDLDLFGKSFKESFNAQVAMFPQMVNPEINEIIETYKNNALGWKLSGAGGGGYLVLVSEQAVKNAIQIRIVR